MLTEEALVANCHSEKSPGKMPISKFFIAKFPSYSEVKTPLDIYLQHHSPLLLARGLWLHYSRPSALARYTEVKTPLCAHRNALSASDRD